MKDKSQKASRARYGARRRGKALRALANRAEPKGPQIDPVVVAELEGRVESGVQENSQLRDTVARQRADFDNFRRRTLKEKDQVRDATREEVITKLLPVLDNFERALASTQSAVDAKSICDGITMVAGQLLRMLEAEGLKRIETANASFDPNEHEALATEERDDVEENRVCEEMLPGYRYKDKVIRPAMVKVAKAPVQKAEA